MKTLIPSSKKHVLKILSSLLLLFAMTGASAQEVVPDKNLEIFNKGDMNKLNADPDKAATYRLNVVGSDALIHGITVGRGAGTGTLNLVYGEGALFSNTTGYENTAIGTLALYSNTTGLLNTAIGAYTLGVNTAGDGNTAIGGYTLWLNETGMYNTAIGLGALHVNKTGSNNTAFGYLALLNNTSGFSNVAMGVGALYHNKDRSNLVAVGDSALFNNGLDVTTAIHATANTALGSKALYANTTGYRNTATGFQALYNNTTGYRNTATGYLALSSNTNGYHNTAHGDWALYSNTTGNANTAIGFASLQNNIISHNNTAVGYGAGYLNPTSQGTFVGYFAYASASGFSNITGIGSSVRPFASNQVRIGNTGVTSIGGNADWTKFSDGGYKNNVEEDVAGLDFILKLRPVSYNLDAHRLASDLGEDVTRAEDGSKATAVPDEITQKSRDEKAAIRYTGFIAQEVEATVNDLGVAFSGVDAPVNKSGFYGLRYASFVVPLVRAIQEQQTQIEALSPEGIDALREELSELRQANELLLAAEASLRAENESIRGQVTDILSMLETLGVEMQDCCQQQTTGRNSGTSSLNQMPDNARLEQNTPNPFHENTLIRYFLPEGTHRAQIILTDMAGTQVMALPLEHQGAGQVLIHGGTLPSGTYVYTLTVDGRKVDSKRMVLL